MFYHLRRGMNKHPLKSFSGVDDLCLNYSLVLHNMTEIKADNKINAGNSRRGNMKRIRFEFTGITPTAIYRSVRRKVSSFPGNTSTLQSAMMYYI